MVTIVLGVDMDHAQSLAVVEFKDELERATTLLHHMAEGTALVLQCKQDPVTLVIVQVSILINIFFGIF